MWSELGFPMAGWAARDWMELKREGQRETRLTRGEREGLEGHQKGWRGRRGVVVAVTVWNGFLTTTSFKAVCRTFCCRASAAGFGRER